jgi:hypothetical protein
VPYGTGDFLGGLATCRSQALLVLALAETAGVIVTLPAAAAPGSGARGAASFVAKSCPCRVTATSGHGLRSLPSGRPTRTTTSPADLYTDRRPSLVTNALLCPNPDAWAGQPGRDSVAVLSLAAMSSTESRWPAATLMTSSYASSLVSVSRRPFTP